MSPLELIGQMIVAGFSLVGIDPAWHVPAFAACFLMLGAAPLLICLASQAMSGRRRGSRRYR